MLKRSKKIVIVDDEKITRKRLKEIFTREGYESIAFSHGEEVLKYLLYDRPPLVLLDLKLPDIDGLTLLTEIKRISPETEVIIMTGYASIETAVEAIKKGAFYYITKPLNLEELSSLIKKAEEKISPKEENKRLKQTLTHDNFSYFVGKSKKMQKIYNLIMKVAKVDCNVIIYGETGTDKYLVAKAIHYNSSRKNGPFISFNCAAFSEELIATEIFGYEKGAVPGTYNTKIGALEAANKGTLFLDEIDKMSLSMQTKLLQVLQEKAILREGSIDPIEIDIRIIAATNKDLKEMVQKGTFRKKLFYGLNVVSIEIPPLRERREDIPFLIQRFLDKYNKIFGKDIKGISKEAKEVMLNYPFPGNVRELENIIERAVALAETKHIKLEDLPSDICNYKIKAEQDPSLSLEEQEKYLIKKALETTGYNKTKAAKLLGFSRITLWRKIRKYGL